MASGDSNDPWAYVDDPWYAPHVEHHRRRRTSLPASVYSVTTDDVEAPTATASQMWSGTPSASVSSAPPEAPSTTASDGHHPQQSSHLSGSCSTSTTVVSGPSRTQRCHLCTRSIGEYDKPDIEGQLWWQMPDEYHQAPLCPTCMPAAKSMRQFSETEGRGNTLLEEITRIAMHLLLVILRRMV